MNNELTNLLPPGRRSALSHQYVLRLGVVILLAVSTLIIVSAILLLPTYVFLAKNLSTQESRLSRIESSLSSANEKTLLVRLATLTSNAAILTTLAKAPSASASIRNAFTVPRPGVSLSTLVYTPPSNKSSGTLVVSGIAASRDALRNYQIALQGASFVRSATLPVSAYAQDTDIAFTITIVFTP